MSRGVSEQDALAAFGQLAKKKLRERLSATRRALPESALSARSARIVQALDGLEPLRAARAVASFWPMPGRAEVDLRPLDALFAERRVARYYPFMDAKGQSFVTGFRRIESSEELQPRGQRFAEPPRDAPVARRGEIDVVIVPALAVTPDGHRLGYGRGFYDATLPDVAPPALTIVVAFSFQLMGELFVEPHDVRCDLVVTDQEISDPRGVLVGPPGAPPR
ncbi:MAG TPA: 5-formyltetrahydrofolate cyclo-ligase [Polyangiaceae bacterium]|jgi:5-formyltetrahydrofolate cyclo-ligase|nr:5-formyltetrahydrofolate cyclo-ligase [Polyangiaceae bacterium]